MPLSPKKRKPKIAEEFFQSVKGQQERSKKWYDKQARGKHVEFQVGDKIAERVVYADTWEPGEIVAVQKIRGHT